MARRKKGSTDGSRELRTLWKVIAYAIPIFVAIFLAMLALFLRPVASNTIALKYIRDDINEIKRELNALKKDEFGSNREEHEKHEGKRE